MTASSGSTWVPHTPASPRQLLEPLLTASIAHDGAASILSGDRVPGGLGQATSIHIYIYYSIGTALHVTLAAPDAPAATCIFNSFILSFLSSPFPFSFFVLSLLSSFSPSFVEIEDLKRFN